MNNKVFEIHEKKKVNYQLRDKNNKLIKNPNSLRYKVWKFREKYPNAPYQILFPKFLGDNPIDKQKMVIRTYKSQFLKKKKKT